MITIWKEKAHNKSITRADMVAYCILKAMHCKSENKEELVKIFCNRAFRPKQSGEYQGFELAKSELRREIMYRETILGSKELYEEVDIDQFRILLTKVML